jgi:hypothetical protein
MATSRSGSQSAEWSGRASVFSGRPDPTWTVNDHVARELMAIWGGLPPWEGELPTAPALGYRGCALRDSAGREWSTHGDVVRLTQESTTQCRVDPGRRFERRLLSSAPKGLLPSFAPGGA